MTNPADTAELAVLLDIASGSAVRTAAEAHGLDASDMQRLIRQLTRAAARELHPVRGGTHRAAARVALTALHKPGAQQ